MYTEQVYELWKNKVASSLEYLSLYIIMVVIIWKEKVTKHWKLVWIICLNLNQAPPLSTTSNKHRTFKLQIQIGSVGSC